VATQGSTVYFLLLYKAHLKRQCFNLLLLNARFSYNRVWDSEGVSVQLSQFFQLVLRRTS
jgi:hypothetical protein